MFYKIPKIEYHRPKTKKELFELMESLEEYKLVAGGTDLVMDLKIGRYRPKHVIDITEIRELKYVRKEGNLIRIGSLTTLRELENSTIIKREAKVLHEAIQRIGSWHVRNVATIGGNLCNASPAADSAPPLMVLDARLRLASKDNTRTIPITEFFKGPRKTEIKKGEILEEIYFETPSGKGSKFLRIGKRSGFTLSIVAVAAMIEVKNNAFSDVKIALNAVAPTPVRAIKAEEFLKNKSVTIENIEKGAQYVLDNIKPITDQRASAEYRKEMAVMLTKLALLYSLSEIGIKLMDWEGELL